MASNAARVPNMTGTNVGSKARNATSKLTNSASEAVNKLKSSDKLPMIILIAVTVLIFVFVILYITFAMKSSSLDGKTLVKKPINLDKLSSPVQVPNGEMPKSVVGMEYSYVFWMYLERFVQTADSNNITKPYHKLIMYRGSVDDQSSANPIIFMDGLSNKLYVVIKTTESSLSQTDKSLHSILSNNYFLTDKSFDDTTKNLHLVMTIDYVPLQRWVQVGCVVDNKVITLYLDGEIYSVKSVDEFRSARKPYVNRLGKEVPYNLIIDKTDGDLFIGKNNLGNRYTIEGYIGKVEYFNYALTMKDVKNSYYSGPISKGILSMFGISQYGFRSPVYKMNEVVQ